MTNVCIRAQETESLLSLSSNFILFFKNLNLFGFILSFLHPPPPTAGDKQGKAFYLPNVVILLLFQLNLGIISYFTTVKGFICIIQAFILLNFVHIYIYRIERLE